jgi:Recombination directionality factor-like
MIKGLTHTSDGQPIQRLAVSTKVAIGLPPDPTKNRKAPMKLDCFIFLKKSETEQNKWVEDKELTKLFGNKCKEFEVVFLDDELENVFPTKLAWFTASGMKCFGDGESAVRKTEENPHGQPWGPCGPTCPDYQRKDCKPSGDLFFMLAALPKLGCATRLHTSGHRSIQQINTSLQQLKDRFGRLAGIRCKLVVKPEKTSYSTPDGKRHSTTIYALHLEMVAEDMQKLIARTTDHAQLFESTRKMLGTGRLQVIESDEDRAEEIHSEFYPPSEISPAQFERAEQLAAALPNMSIACAGCGQVDGHAADCEAVKSKSEQKQKPSTRTVQEAPTMCSECRKIGSHETGCKFAPAEPKPDPATKFVMGAYMLSKAEKKAKKPAKGDDATAPAQVYLALTAASIADSKPWMLYVWHKHLHELFANLDLSKPVPIRVEYSQQFTKGPNPKEFYAVEHVHEINGKIFVDDKGPTTTAVDDSGGLFGEADQTPS